MIYICIHTYTYIINNVNHKNDNNNSKERK